MSRFDFAEFADSHKGKAESTVAKVSAFINDAVKLGQQTFFNNDIIDVPEKATLKLRKSRGLEKFNSQSGRIGIGYELTHEQVLDLMTGATTVERLCERIKRDEAQIKLTVKQILVSLAASNGYRVRNMDMLEDFMSYKDFWKTALEQYITENQLSSTAYREKIILSLLKDMDINARNSLIETINSSYSVLLKRRA